VSTFGTPGAPKKEESGIALMELPATKIA
jgi:hypothetical protein